MEKDAPDPSQHFSNLTSAYTEAIRLSDFKANLAVLFVAIMMGPIVAFRANYPHFLPLPIVLTPFIIAFFCLLICVYPRYPRRGKRNFLVLRHPQRSDFVFVENGVRTDIEQLRMRSVNPFREYWLEDVVPQYQHIRLPDDDRYHFRPAGLFVTLEHGALTLNPPLSFPRKRESILRSRRLPEPRLDSRLRGNDMRRRAFRVIGAM